MGDSVAGWAHWVMTSSGGHYGVLIVVYWSLEIVIENWVMGGW